MALQLKRRFNQAAPLIGSIHRDRRLCDQGRSLVVFIKGKKELVAGCAILFAIMVDPLDRLTQNTLIKGVCVVEVGGLVLA